jgi:hydrogenase expression/formation protein HypE
MKKGKLDSETLERLVLGRTGARRPEVVCGPQVGEDCAVVDFGLFDCVLSTDPITASAEKIGSLAVHVSCNDIASNGVEPMAVLLTVLLPEQTTEAEIEEIIGQADAAARELGVQIIGGHTEITDAVTQPLISATALGRAPKPGQKGTVSGDMRPGDRVLVTKSLALEGACILAERCEKELGAILTDAEIEEAKAFLGQISVVKEGVLAGKIGVSAMHDITEGGILGAVWETCALHGVGAEIDMMSLPFEEVTLAICAFLGLNPMRLISSGSMLIIVPEEKAAMLATAIREAGIPATDIGRVTDGSRGVVMRARDGKPEAVEPPGPDEIYMV